MLNADRLQRPNPSMGTVGPAYRSLMFNMYANQGNSSGNTLPGDTKWALVEVTRCLEQGMELNVASGVDRRATGLELDEAGTFPVRGPEVEGEVAPDWGEFRPPYNPEWYDSQPHTDLCSIFGFIIQNIKCVAPSWARIRDDLAIDLLTHSLPDPPKCSCVPRGTAYAVEEGTIKLSRIGVGGKSVTAFFVHAPTEEMPEEEFAKLKVLPYVS